MVESDLEQIGGGGVARDVAAELGMRAVSAYYHRERVPADDRGQAALQLEISRELRLLGERHGILVGRVEDRRHRHETRARVLEELSQEERRALATFSCDQRIEGFQPFARFDGIDVRRVHAPVSRRDDIGKISHGRNYKMVAAQRWKDVMAMVLSCARKRIEHERN